MSNPDYSKDSYFDFIDYVSKKGLIKQATARNWKNASIRLLTILEEDESQDLRKLDIDALCTRFMNLEKSVSPASMQVYRSRLNTAISDFIAYKDNPMGYKPGIAQRSSRKKSSKEASNSSSGKSKISNNRGSVEQQNHHDQGDKSKGITFPIPLRANLVVEIKHLPHDLTAQEAEKISMVIKALVMKESLKE